MPTYEYACRDCGRHLEVVQSFTDKPLTKCPSCKGVLKKVFSPVGIVLKGSGFYKTDNRLSSSSKASSSTDSTSKESTSKESTKEPAPGASKKDAPSSGGSKKDTPGSSSPSSSEKSA